MFVVTLGLASFEMFLVSYTNIYLAEWSTHFSQKDSSRKLLTFFQMSLLNSACGGGKVIIVSMAAYRLSKRIHSKMAYSVLHSQLEAFLPTGASRDGF